MPASVPSTSVVISRGSPTRSGPRSPLTRPSLRMSGRGSISGGEDFEPFWNASAQEASGRLWLPTETASVASGSTSWRTCSARQARALWCTTREMPALSLSSLTTSSQWPRSSSLARTGSGAVATVAPESDGGKRAKTTVQATKATQRAVRARAIRVYPTAKQAKTLRRWFGTTRATYNWCVEAIQKAETEAREAGTPRPKITLKWLRDRCVARGASIPAWAHEVPFDIRDSAVRGVIKARANAWAKYRATGTVSVLSFRSRYDPSMSIDVCKKHWGTHRSGAFSGLFSASALHASPRDSLAYQLPETLEMDARLVRKRTGEWVMCIPVTPVTTASTREGDADIEVMGARPARASSATPLRVAAIDPGVRTFATVYSPSGVTEWGKEGMGRIIRLAHAYDVLQSRWTSKATRHRQRWRLKRAGLRINARIRRLTRELHRQLARYLEESFDVVLLPAFESSTMVNKKRGRRIGSRTARAMLTWGHFKFRQHMLQKAEAAGTRFHVEIVSEAYTSKTCGACGALHTQLGGAKVFHCPNIACGVTLDRDVNGARNILLRFLTSRSATPSVPASGTRGGV